MKFVELIYTVDAVSHPELAGQGGKAGATGEHAI